METQPKQVTEVVEREFSTIEGVLSKASESESRHIEDLEKKEDGHSAVVNEQSEMINAASDVSNILQEKKDQVIDIKRSAVEEEGSTNMLVTELGGMAKEADKTIENLQEQEDSLKDLKYSFEQQKEAARRSEDEVAAKKDETGREVRIHEQIYSELSSRISTLVHQNSLIEETGKQVENANKARQLKIEDIQNGLQKAQKTAAVIQSEKDQVQQKVNEILAQLELAKAELSQINSKNALVNGEVKQLQDSKDTGVEELALGQSQISALLTAKDEFIQEINSLNDKMADEESKKTKLTESERALAAQLQELHEQVVRFEEFRNVTITAIEVIHHQEEAEQAKVGSLDSSISAALSLAQYDRELGSEAAYNATILNEAIKVTSEIADQATRALQEEEVKLKNVEQEKAIAIETKQELDEERLLLKDVAHIISESEVEKPQPEVRKPEVTEFQRFYVLEKLVGNNFSSLRFSDKEQRISEVAKHLCDEKVDPEALKNDSVLYEQLHVDVYNTLVAGVIHCSHHDEL